MLQEEMDTMIRLPPFDSEAVCPKCGWADVDVTYHKWPTYDCPFPSYLRRDAKEHLDRRCRRCYYSWSEEGLDQDGRGNEATQ